MSEYASVASKLPDALNRPFTDRIVKLHATITGDSRYSVGEILLNDQTLNTDANVKSEAVMARLWESDDE